MGLAFRSMSAAKQLHCQTQRSMFADLHGTCQMDSAAKLVEGIRRKLYDAIHLSVAVEWQHF